jgi:cytoskeletal protein CcmA (bactofilin family)
LLIIGGGVVLAVSFLKSNNQPASNGTNAATQNLSPQALQELANNGTTIGDPKQTLNIQSNSVFQGTVLVRGNLEVAGTVKMGGTLALQALTVSGTGSFNTLQAKSLSVDGNTGFKGQLAAASLSIAGGGSFKGAVTAASIATSSLQLNGNLSVTHHIDVGGPGPGRSNGGALGSGGTSSVSGSDTAGSISIHTGDGTSAGCFVTVFFARPFGSTPHVVVTPVGSAAGKTQYYINRSSGSFSVCTANAAASGSSFGFDYIVIG